MDIVPLFRCGDQRTIGGGFNHFIMWVLTIHLRALGFYWFLAVLTLSLIA